MPTKIISLFNHKGGVSKTTTAFNLGWALAERGKRVLLVDADPQCNLTGMVLSLSGQEELQEFYTKNPNANVYDTVRPAFSGSPIPLAPAHPASTTHKEMFLFAGHIGLATYEPELSMAQKLIGAMPILSNLPGALGHLMRITAEAINAEYVLVDMSPSIGALNQNLLMQSDFFIVPTSPDFFCYMAIESLAAIIPQWHATAELIRKQNPGLTYKMPPTSPRFIGMISQRYRPRYSHKPAQAFQRWIDAIVKRVRELLVPALEPIGMAMPAAGFDAVLGKGTAFELAQIPEFNSLIALSQEFATPIFALTDAQLSSVGVVLEQRIAARNNFRTVFLSLADHVVALTATP